MRYQTMALALLEQRPELYERLRREKRLLTASGQLALELKTRHEQWQTVLGQGSAEIDPSQIPSAALELALQELEQQLPVDSASDDSAACSLEAAMAFLRRHLPPE